MSFQDTEAVLTPEIDDFLVPQHLGAAPSYWLPHLKETQCGYQINLCYAIVLPSRKSGFRAGFRPDSNSRRGGANGSTKNV